jgi:hypothetical protein
VIGADPGRSSNGSEQKFDALHAEGQQALRTGTYQLECSPADGDPRWAVGAVLRPDRQAARAIEQVAGTAAAVVGANHWLAGAARSSHLTLRRQLEPWRRQISPADPLIARYGAALCSVAGATDPVRFTLTGLILTPTSVMAAAVPTDMAAHNLAVAFDLALRAQGCDDAGTIPGLWYVNLAYFTGPVHDVEGLIGWVEERRTMHVAELRVTHMQIVRWQYTATGMVPIQLAAFAQR